MTKRSKAKIFLGSWDEHFPLIHSPTWNIIKQIAGDNPIAGFVKGGDQFNNDCISHHNEGKPGLQGVPGQFALDEEMYDEIMLAPLEKLLPKNCEKVWIEGNHDYWEAEYEQKYPTLQGKMRRAKNLRLEQRGWKVIPLGHIYKYGKVAFVHGEGIGTVNHAKRAVEVYCCNVLYGHHHARNVFTKILSSDFKEKWVAECNPIVGITNPDYLRNRPNGWLNGLSSTEFHPDGAFNHYAMVTTNNKVSYHGQIYEG